MGEARRKKLLKKTVNEKYTDLINQFIESLDYYQIYTKFHIQKKGWEINELVQSGRLDPASFKDHKIVENNTYDMAVSEWQWVNHKSSIEKRILYNEAKPVPSPVEEVFEAYTKYITDTLDKGCIDQPEKYRKMNSEEFKAKIEEFKRKAIEAKEGSAEADTRAKNVAEFYNDVMAAFPAEVPELEAQTESTLQTQPA